MVPILHTHTQSVYIIIHVVWPARCVYPRNLPWSLAVPPETASLDDEDKMSDGDEDDSKDKINSPKFDNRTLKCVNNGRRLRKSVPNAQHFTFVLFATLVTHTKIMNDSQ